MHILILNVLEILMQANMDVLLPLNVLLTVCIQSGLS